MKKFSDIKQMPFAYYQTHVSWDYLEDHLERYERDHNLELEPDFQRAHVWTEEQQRKYVEWIMRGGFSGRDVFLNHSDWMNFHDRNAHIILVDGLQRITAVLKFLRNELTVFDGKYRKDFEGRINSDWHFIFHVNNLKTRKEILEWYLSFNSGGTIHTEKELNKVRKLLEKENEKR